MGRSACVTCHQRKVKCDAQTKGFPCSNCISSGKSDCRIHQKKRRALARSVNNPIKILSRSAAADCSNNGSRSLQAFQVAVDEPRSPQSPGPTTNTAEQHHVEANGGADYLAEPGSFEGRTIHKGVRITYVGKDVSNIGFLVRQQQQQQQQQRLAGQNENEDKVYHFPSTEIARKYMRHESDRVPHEAFMLPEKALADELVDAYFAHVNPGCPVLDEDVFMAQYGGQDPADPPSLLVLQAVLLVGAHVSRERPERDVLKTAFFRRAKLLFDARVEWNRDYMVQAALLLTWYSDGVEDVVANAWYWVGVAQRIAIGLGMHRDTAGSSLASSDKNRWRRIWWMLFQYDVTVSLFYGRPQAINLDECDVAPLDVLDLEGCRSETQIEYVLKYTELCVLISRVLRERFAVRATTEPRKATLISADEALAKWCLLLPPSLHLRSSGTSLWASALHLAYSNFLILLHRPNPRTSLRHRINDSGPNDADICIAAANAVTTIFEDMRNKDQIRYMGLAGVNALFTGMIQVSVELRFSNPILAIHARRRFDSTLLSLREVAEYWVVGESILRLFEKTAPVPQQEGQALNGGDSSIAATRTTRTTAAAAAREGRSPSLQFNQRRRQNGTTTSRRSFQAQDAQVDNLPSAAAAAPRSDLDVLAAAADAAVQSIHAGLIEQEQEEVGDWRQLFPFTSSSSSSLLSPEDQEDGGGGGGGGFMLPPQGDMMMLSSVMEDEWREMYWQEQNMFEGFGDVFGGGGSVGVGVGGGWP